MQKQRRVLIVGAGPAGVFAALSARESCPDASIVLLERSAQPLSKLRLSGGGRCNLSNATPEPRALAAHYPRGGRELIGALSRFGPAQTMAWFEQHGVALRIEDEGRVFPATGRAATVVECLLRELAAANVELRTESAVTAIERATDGLRVVLDSGNSLCADTVLLAAGGGERSTYGLASQLGHTIVEPVPSLFGLRVEDTRVSNLAGVSVPDVELTLEGRRARVRGALLLTHEGVSGPAVLQLSSVHARNLSTALYQAALMLNWLPSLGQQELRDDLAALRDAEARSPVAKRSPFALPLRLWQSLVAAAGCDDGRSWAGLSRAHLHALVEQLTQCRLRVTGRCAHKDEFVTCGGVSLAQVDMRGMQSKLLPGLFFAGEILDIDGFTGGFNLQAAWTTGRLAGAAAAGSC